MGSSLTLSSVIVDIGVIGVVFDGFLKCFKRLFRVALLHVHTRNLDP